MMTNTNTSKQTYGDISSDSVGHLHNIVSAITNNKSQNSLALDKVNIISWT